MTVDPRSVKAAKGVLQNSLSISPGEEILLVFDSFGYDIAHAFEEAAGDLQLSLCSRFVSITNQKRYSTDDPTAPDLIPKCMVHSHALITAVTELQEATSFRVALLSEAVGRNLKIVHMPGVTNNLFIEATQAFDYAGMQEEAETLRASLSVATTLEIHTRTNKGTLAVLRCSVAKRPVHADAGRAIKGEIINIPSGEVYVAPHEGEAEGELVLNGSADEVVFRGADEVVLAFSAGRVDLTASKFSRTATVQRFAKYLGGLNDDPEASLALCEVGIGLNAGMKQLVGRTIADEKAVGTCHIALGANTPFGGSIDCSNHDDLVLIPEAILLDGVPLQHTWRKPRRGWAAR